jgi:hypothetical protein
MSESGLVTKLNPWVQYKTVRARLEVLLFGSPRTLTFSLTLFFYNYEQPKKGQLPILLSDLLGIHTNPK